MKEITQAIKTLGNDLLLAIKFIGSRQKNQTLTVSMPYFWTFGEKHI